MTDYTAKRGGWRKYENAKKWQDLVAIFITAVLLLAILNGLFKTVSLKKFLGQSQWDGKSSFVVALATVDPAVLIYQNDSERIVVLKVDKDTYFETGRSGVSVKTLTPPKTSEDIKEFLKMVSSAFGTKIENYVVFSREQGVDEQEVQKFFKSFASIVTPFLILSNKVENGWETNITRVDLFRLWWRVKAFGTDKLNLVGVSAYREEVLTADGQRVLGVDSEGLNRKIKEFLVIGDFAKEKYEVKILDATGNKDAARLAENFVSSVGLDVVQVSSVSERPSESRVIGSDGDVKALKYLAKIFECDILTPGGELSKPDEELEITVVLGRDFAAKYFE